jgi:hypothetical protein
MSDCILWQGPVDRQGYGKVWHDGGSRIAHRVAWVQEHGEVAADVDIHHICGVKACVNLEHLQALTRAEHGRLHPFAQRPACGQGHEYTEANTYVRPNGQRCCRACWREATARYQQRKKVAA